MGEKKQFRGMIDLLTKPAFQKRALPLSVAAWHGLITKNLVPKRSELIRGMIVEKTPKSILHVKLVGRLLQLLQTWVGSTHWVRKEDPLTLTDSEPESDVSGHETDYVAHPATALLTVEVSVSTLEEDREMALIYAEAGVAEFWIVNVRQQAIEVYREPTPAGYIKVESIPLEGTVVCESLPGVRVAVRELFEGLVPGEQAERV
ncbi:Uma2 family endonuclease [Prosthecobacter sp. SYSU 5D2]|uniref:Uma2 family endonuclease n=1 Tax=Prosthecobacter sp. SYSU 5D2 TaxID=3134134 RepID=UPI0031FE94B6